MDVVWLVEESGSMSCNSLASRGRRAHIGYPDGICWMLQCMDERSKEI